MPGRANDEYFPPSTGAPVLSVTYNSDRSLAAVVCSDSSIQVWAPVTRKVGLQPGQAPDKRISFQLPEPGASVTCCSWAPGERGCCAAIGTSSGVVHILQQLPSQQDRGTGSWHLAGKIQAGLGPVGEVAFAPGHFRNLVLAVAVQPAPPRRSVSSSSALGTSGSGSSVLQLYEAPAEWVRPLKKWTHLSKVQLTAASPCNALAWCRHCPGLPPLLLAGADSGAAVWRYNQPAMTWEEVCVLPTPAGLPTTSALAVDWCPPLNHPASVAVVAVSYGKTVVLWRLVNTGPPGGSSGTAAAASAELVLTGSMEASLEHPAAVWQVSFDQGGSSVACGLTGQPGVWVWRQDTVGKWVGVVKVKGVDPGMLALQGDADMAAADLDLD